MIGAVISTVLLVGSLCLMIAAIVNNQMNPSLGSALGIPIANGISLILVLLASLIAFFVQRNDENAKLAKRVMILGLIMAVGFAVLFPLSETGQLGSAS